MGMNRPDSARMRDLIMRVIILLLITVGLGCSDPIVGEKYESKSDGVHWTVAGVFTGDDASVACGQDVKSCIRLTNSEKVGAKYVSGKYLRDEYWYLGRG